MRASISLKARADISRGARKCFLNCLVCMSYPGMLLSQTLHGFVLIADPASDGGAKWTYRDMRGGIIYDLAGVLLISDGTANLLAVVISHGHNGNVNTYTINIAQEMRSWGLVCIVTNCMHTGGVPIGSPGDSTQPGASMANILRARKRVGILASLGYLDTTMDWRVHLWYTANGLFTVSGVNEREHAVPRTFSLGRNFPNPFSTLTTILYGLTQRAHVTISVYNPLCQRVAVLVSDIEDAGYHGIRFDGSSLASGSYFY